MIARDINLKKKTNTQTIRVFLFFYGNSCTFQLLIYSSLSVFENII